MIPDLCWVKQGVSKESPDVVKLNEEELQELIANTQKNLNVDEGNDVEEGEEEEGAEGDENQDCNMDNEKEEAPAKPVNEEDEFDMANYDNGEDDEAMAQRIFGAGLGGVAYYSKPEEDPYITLPEVARDDEDTYDVSPTDNLICCAKLDGEMSSIEVHLWNGEEEDFYVHHDILLDTFPLCLEWLSFDPGSEVEGSFVAVGCMNPQVQIWDLDIINTTDPVVVLGERRKQSSKKPKIGTKGHSDAVMSVSWNTQTKNVLASGSADKHVLLWDLESGAAKEVLNHHTDKVQSLSWHLAEGQTILTGGYDHTAHVVDCRTKSSKKWILSGEIEAVLWDVTNPYAFLAGTAGGDVFCVDIRQEKPLYTLSAHSNEVSGLTMNRALPGCLVTCSADKIVKVWDIKDNKPTCIHARDFTDSISLHCVSFCPDNKYQLAIGGLEGGLLMWDIGTNKEVREHFG